MADLAGQFIGEARFCLPILGIERPAGGNDHLWRGEGASGVSTTVHRHRRGDGPYLCGRRRRSPPTASSRASSIWMIAADSGRRRVGRASSHPGKCRGASASREEVVRPCSGRAAEFGEVAEFSEN